ncbi:5-deoxy-glucuronate isomerase [Terrabacter sp. C0L_2]|uniref:5-deoxy-glucuronate isomerase n=1 Tax=Terrabacter sp. C0L_2 TaxID=3108389 RepID=UPI002ED5F196|nr:5-deoxy-glucuronate isomerase [Terrabacter sp. C0L_2]
MTWHRPIGTASRDGWDVVVEPDAAGWEHTGLHVGRLAAGESRRLGAGHREHVVVPLSGSVTVSVDGAAGEHEVTLAGRASVFAGPTDVAYVPAGSGLTVTALGDARVAVCFAVTRAGTAGADVPFRHVAAAEVPVELRGSGIASREVRNFGIPGVLEAESIIACEVVTPAGNWSSWPPHKHDEERPGEETQLEEIYYFEVAPEAGSPKVAGTDPVGYQRVYGTEHRPIEVLAEVRPGDVVLVPHGWHGPAMAAPGYDLYYLNVMAGPGEERAWLIRDDPAHGWVRDTWTDRPVDPRLPFGGAR